MARRKSARIVLHPARAVARRAKPQARPVQAEPLEQRTCLSATLPTATLAAGSAGTAPASHASSSTATAADAARQALDRYLSHISGASNGQIELVNDAPLGQAFPKVVFFALSFPQYPVARLGPPPLKSDNVFAVFPGGAVQLITSDSQLTPFFQKQLAPVKSSASAAVAAKAWLDLSIELHEDGFFQFTIPDNEVVVTQVNGGFKVHAEATVLPRGGDRGELDLTLMFSAAGKLVSATEINTLRAGIRPICQATKLLDDDPIVRGMAEQSILVMGERCKSYLDMQHALADGNPALQSAIDHIWKRIVDDAGPGRHGRTEVTTWTAPTPQHSRRKKTPTRARRRKEGIN